MFASARKQSEDLASRYPALLSQARRISANVVHGIHGRRQAGMGESFWEFRHAGASDTAADIDWRRSGKSDELFVRETEWEAANTILFWRDGSVGMDWSSDPQLPTKRDRASVLLTALAIALLKGGERCMVPGISDRPGSGMAAIERISREIILETTDPAAIAQAGRMRHARLILASDFLDGEATWHERFAHISATGLPVTLLHIADPQEEDFSYTRHTRFRAPGANERLDFGRPQMVRDVYRQRYAQNRQAITGIAQRNGWEVFSHRTDHAPADIFLALYESLAEGAHSP